MKVFGVNNFGYKFPSILFALLAIYATYRLAKRLYGESVGRTSALVLATCQGMFLMTNDIRCDTILMSWTITAVWLIQEWIMSRKLIYFIGGCAAIAFGMMTKGPIALMVPAFCFISDWILKRHWRNFLQPSYILGLLVIALLLIPMSIGLYQQFDLHPEKLVNDKHAVSGLRFFYWSQSFGRITGESPWKNAVDITFLLQNMLWSFLPWIFLFLPAVVLNVIQLFRQKLRLLPEQEWITTGGFLLTYLALGSSSYQLPHYIFIAFPLAAIITAKLLHELVEDGKYKVIYRVIKPFFLFISSVLLVLVLVLMLFIFPAPPLAIILWGVCVIVWVYFAIRGSLPGKLLCLSAAAMIIANAFLTNHVYAPLLHYQAGSEVGGYIQAKSIPAKDVAVYKMDDPLNSINFYAHDFVPVLDTLSNLRHKYILTMEKGLAEVKQSGLAYTIEKQGLAFKVSELTPDFLNPKSRGTVAKTYYLLKVRN